DRISKSENGGKALLFENTGTGFPLLINSMGSEKRIAMALSRSYLSEIEKEIEAIFKMISGPKDSLWDKLKMLPKLKEFSSWMPKKVSGKGKCQEIILNEPDLGIFPVLKCWPADGGRFITLPGVHTVDPETGTPNLGMYRMQIFEKNVTGMHWHKHKTGANHFEKYKKSGKKMPVSVALGGDPVYTYAATAPMPENMDEYMLAGFLRKKQVRLVKCLTNDLYVPEDADIIIEGYVDPKEDLLWEGPFGDHTGFYSLADYYPAFHVTCITHRKDAVYPATIVGIPPMEDAWIGKATERIFLTPIRMTMIPELKDMDLPFAGVAHNLSIVKIEKSFAGQAIKVMNSLWGAGQMMFNKILIVVDNDVDIHNYSELAKIIFKRFNPENSLHFSKGPLDILDHSSTNFAFGSKLGVDATVQYKEENSGLIKPEDKNTFNNNAIEKIPEILEFNDLKEKFDIPVCIFSVQKNNKFRKQELINKLAKEPVLTFFKLMVFVDSGVDINDIFSIVWMATGNIEPQRDISVLRFSEGSSTLLVDATVKTGGNDNFKRDWPNVVVSDKHTIEKTDKKWNSLGLGEFIPSPSLKYLPLVKNKGAVRN
ncbi:MAG: menaquinone biosynthesis decarboxylase, partial [Prolixibacteraceae bacterium]|nr:menaquinone biosynthesis decarboxylase [Prolixibacteraceae bacterium]